MILTPTQNCISQTAHKNCTAFYSPDGVLILRYEGRYYNAAEFEEAFPISTKVEVAMNYKGENSDRTKNWMNNNKSY